MFRKSYRKADSWAHRFVIALILLCWDHLTSTNNQVMGMVAYDLPLMHAYRKVTIHDRFVGAVSRTYNSCSESVPRDCWDSLLLHATHLALYPGPSGYEATSLAAMSRLATCHGWAGGGERKILYMGVGLGTCRDGDRGPCCCTVESENEHDRRTCLECEETQL